jgi:DMSO/TMAO reductase YedYZ molybdopterin-dependent catalytic subunit
MSHQTDEGIQVRCNRRGFIKLSTSGLALAGAARLAPLLAADPRIGPATLPQGALDSALFDALPGKVALIKKSFRPPNFETPVSYFDQAFTPNDAFFVRYHLASIPRIDAAAWRLRVGGEAADQSFELTLDSLKRDFDAVEIAAVCQCSGNRRGLSNPHVTGVEWGYGAMGNARWKGARLKDVLARAGLKKDALEVVIEGADGPALDKTPDFVKSLPVWKALDENTLLAYEMNGEPLPHWNGYPVRIVVPGWTATYWMKHVTSLRAVSRPYNGFWMEKAYRIPKGKFPIVDRFISQETESNTPITEMVVNSLITNLQEDSLLSAGKPAEIRGIAWDGGFGMRTVEVSVDGGDTWRPAQLGPDLGRFAWRQWTYTIAAPQPGYYTVMARATNKAGATQTFDLIFNPAGYHNNVVQRLKVQVA